MNAPLRLITVIPMQRVRILQAHLRVLVSVAIMEMELTVKVIILFCQSSISYKEVSYLRILTANRTVFIYLFGSCLMQNAFYQMCRATICFDYGYTATFLVGTDSYGLHCFAQRRGFLCIEVIVDQFCGRRLFLEISVGKGFPVQGL